jgi:hypothetical protein
MACYATKKNSAEICMRMPRIVIYLHNERKAGVVPNKESKVSNALQDEFDLKNQEGKMV